RAETTRRSGLTLRPRPFGCGSYAISRGRLRAATTSRWSRSVVLGREALVGRVLHRAEGLEGLLRLFGVAVEQRGLELELARQEVHHRAAIGRGHRAALGLGQLLRRGGGHALALEREPLDLGERRERDRPARRVLEVLAHDARRVLEALHALRELGLGLVV